MTPVPCGESAAAQYVSGRPSSRLLAGQPASALDYPRTDTGEWLANCSACAVPEIANVFKRARIPFHQITGILNDDPVCWNEVDAWFDAVRVAGIMAHNRLGLMGHYYGGMLDIYSDATLQCATFGGHIEILEGASYRKRHQVA